jgi:hypothetical protein
LWKTPIPALSVDHESWPNAFMKHPHPVTLPDDKTFARCVDCARPRITELLSSGFDVWAVNWALQWGFFDILARFSGNEDQAVRADAFYERLTEAARADVPECKNRVQDILLQLRREKFDPYVIALTMITALQNLVSKSPLVPDVLKKQHTAALLRALHRAAKRQDPDTYRRSRLH